MIRVAVAASNNEHDGIGRSLSAVFRSRLTEVPRRAGRNGIVPTRLGFAGEGSSDVARRNARGSMGGPLNSLLSRWLSRASWPDW